MPLAQLDRAFDYESKGQEFESLRARHKNFVMRRCGGTGRRARLKIVRETVGVRVPSPALQFRQKEAKPHLVLPLFDFYINNFLMGRNTSRFLDLLLILSAVALIATPNNDRMRFLFFLLLKIRIHVNVITSA